MGLCEFVADGLGDAGTHFVGGGVGEGEDEEVFDIAAPPPSFSPICGFGEVAEEAGAALCEDGGFAGAGGGGDEQVAGDVVDRGELGRGPSGGHGHRYRKS